ncbi:MAG: hypothetical protein WCQ95_01135 [Bacteroidota bacterium]
MHKKTFSFSGYFAFSMVVIFQLFLGCKSIEKNTQINKTNGYRISRPKVVIYKTTSDYFNNVPVILSENKTKIVSYPDVKDVSYNGSLAYPTRLKKGYLLDNRGINKNVAFLHYSYEEYSKLGTTPTAESLIKMIIDFNPVLEIYLCDCSRDTVELNKIIANGFKEICTNTQ